jgi:hypothetical protein
MSVRSVKDAVRAVTINDNRLDKADAQKILDAAGGSVSEGEANAIRESLQSSSYEVAGDARQLIQSSLSDINSMRRHAEQQNRTVSRRAVSLESEEKSILEPGAATKSFGGSPVPEAVKAIVNTALAAGAVAYDVAELDAEPAKDDHGDGFTVTGKWSPYPQEIRASGSMSFSHTELTPEKLQKDMETEQTFKIQKGIKSETVTDRRSGQTQTIQTVEYETVTRKGTGSITSQYDEASHPDTMARARNGDKWASNFGILADGSFHALPASRRTASEPGLILTNPSLARGKRMLFNGHITIQNGVVTSIGMSGRLQKMAADGDAKFVNPLPLLEAWGFKISPNLRLNFEGSGPDPKIDANTHAIGD